MSEGVSQAHPSADALAPTSTAFLDQAAAELAVVRASQQETARQIAQARDAEDRRLSEREYERTKKKAQRANPEFQRHRHLVEKANNEAMRILRERHRAEFERIYCELREAFGVPVKEAELPQPAIPAADAHRCHHEPEKRSYGIFCKLCETKLN